MENIKSKNPASQVGVYIKMKGGEKMILYARPQIEKFLNTASQLEKEGKTEHIQRMFATIDWEHSYQKAVEIFYDVLTEKYLELVKYL